MKRRSPADPFSRALLWICGWTASNCPTAPGRSGRGSPGLRELGEETGLTADSFRYLGPLLASPGFSDEVIHLYLAQGLHQGPCHPDPDEFLEFCRIPFAELLEQAMDGRLQDAKTVAGLLKTKVLLGL